MQTDQVTTPQPFFRLITTHMLSDSGFHGLQPTHSFKLQSLHKRHSIRTIWDNVISTLTRALATCHREMFDTHHARFRITTSADAKV